jgi:ribonuclease Z
MKVTILGNNSALPAHGRYPTSQVINISEQLFLIDCGEGTQMRMQQFDVKSSRIDHIFISHIHGDHYLGLVGLISSQSLLGRQRALYIYCPAKIKEYITMQMPWSLGFELYFYILSDSECTVLLDTPKVQISCFPVFHSVPTHGFLFIEKKRKRVLLPNKLKDYEIPKYFYPRLAEGEDYVNQQGETILNEWVTEAGHWPKRYAYCADTRFAPEILATIHGVDLLYHETTYLSDNHEKAKLRFHSTTIEAATIAKEAKVKSLIIGHFSSKYKDLGPFLTEAQSIFNVTMLAIEGQTFEV